MTTAVPWRLAAHDRASRALTLRGEPALVVALARGALGETGDDGAIDLLVRAGETAATRAPSTAARCFRRRCD